MNLYLITQSDRGGYDTYDSAVVIAKTKKDAATMHPDGDTIPAECNTTWTNDPGNVKVKFLGIADLFSYPAVICAFQCGLRRLL